MKLLGVPPGAAVAVFAEVVNHQTHILQVPDARLRVPEPKALRMAAHQGGGPLAQLRRSGRGRRKFAQLVRLGIHAVKLEALQRCGKPGQMEADAQKAGRRAPGTNYRGAKSSSPALLEPS